MSSVHGNERSRLQAEEASDVTNSSGQPLQRAGPDAGERVEASVGEEFVRQETVEAAVDVCHIVVVVVVNGLHVDRAALVRRSPGS